MRDRTRKVKNDEARGEKKRGIRGREEQNSLNRN